MALSQGDSGHETLLSEDDSPTPTANSAVVSTAKIERASSEVIYSSITNTRYSMLIRDIAMIYSIHISFIFC